MTCCSTYPSNYIEPIISSDFFAVFDFVENSKNLRATHGTVQIREVI